MKQTKYGEMPESAAEAAKLGLKYYFTGTPCKQGHVALRKTKTGKCTECDRAAPPKAKQQLEPQPVQDRVTDLTKAHKHVTAEMEKLEQLIENPNLPRLQKDKIRKRYAALRIQRKMIEGEMLKHSE